MEQETKNETISGEREERRKKNEREKQRDQWSLIKSVISYVNAGLEHTNLIVCTLPKVGIGFDGILSI